MIILKINRLIERHGKLALIIIAAAVIIPFVFMWGPHSVFDSGAPGRRGLRRAGEMYGETIRFEDLARQLRFVQLQIFDRGGGLVQLTRGEDGEMLLEQALQRMMFLHEAGLRGLDRVAESQIDEWIGMSFPGEDGRFDRGYYEWFRRQFLPQLGLNESDYRQFVGERIAINRLWQEVMGVVFVSPLELDYQVRRNHEQFRAMYRIFDLDDYREEADRQLVSDAEVRRYFDANRGSELPSGEVIVELDEATKSAIREILLREVARRFYRRNVEFLRPYLERAGEPGRALDLYSQAREASPEPDVERFPWTLDQAGQRVDRYVSEAYQPVSKQFRLAVFNRERFIGRVEITEADVRAAYERAAEQYEKRVAPRLLLLGVEGETEEELEEARQHARQQLEEWRQAIIEGEADFSELALEFSEDIRSAGRGGALGLMTRRQMAGWLGESLTDAVFALDERELGEVTETQRGLNLIKVEEVEPARTLAEVREELRDELAMQRSRRAAWTAAEDFAYRVFEDTADLDLDKRAEAMAEMLEDEEARIVDTGFFHPRDWPDIFKGDRAAAAAVYETTREQPLSEVVEANGRFIVALFQDQTPATIPEFDAEPELARQAMEWVRHDRSLELARSEAQRLRGEIVEDHGAEPSAEILRQDYDFSETDFFSRNSPPREVGRYRWLMLEQLEALGLGRLSLPLEEHQGSMVMLLAERREPDPETLAQYRDVARRQLFSRKMDWRTNEFVEQVESRAQMDLIDDLLLFIAR